MTMQPHILAHSFVNLRGHTQNTDNGRGTLKKGQELNISHEFENKFDKNAVVVKTMGGKVVGRIPRQDSKKYLTMLDVIEKNFIYTQVSFVELVNVEVFDNGRRYWENQVKVKIEYMTNASGETLKKRVKKLVRKLQELPCIELVDILHPDEI